MAEGPKFDMKMLQILLRKVAERCYAIFLLTLHQVHGLKLKKEVSLILCFGVSWCVVNNKGFCRKTNKL
jgi:hypothetical protein